MNNVNQYNQQNPHNNDMFSNKSIDKNRTNSYNNQKNIEPYNNYINQDMNFNRHQNYNGNFPINQPGNNMMGGSYHQINHVSFRLNKNS